MLAQAGRLLEEDLRQHRHHVLAAKGRASREALEEHAPEREDVGAGIDGAIATRLLRRHVARRADERARAGGEACLGREPRDAEVEDADLGELAVTEEEVARLQIAVDDAPRMRRRDRVRDVVDEPHRFERRKRLPRETTTEIFTLEPLQRQPELTLARRAVIDVANDARKAQIGERARLTLEALTIVELVFFTATLATIEEDLERDRRTFVAIERAVDRRHAPRGDVPLDGESIGETCSGMHRPSTALVLRGAQSATAKRALIS